MGDAKEIFDPRGAIAFTWAYLSEQESAITDKFVIKLKH